MEATLLHEGPPAVWILHIPAGDHFRPPFDWMELLRRMDPSRVLLGSLFRAVSLDLLPKVLSTGVDVEPSNAVVYAGDFEKAWEYGGLPKLVAAYDPRMLKSSCLEIPAATPPEELRRLTQDYPTQLQSRDGQRLWLSRLPKDDTALATPYEAAWAYWIPGNAKAALRAVIICVRPEDASRVADLT